MSNSQPFKNPKLMTKAIYLFVLAIVLLIPLALIQNLVNDRKDRYEEAVENISKEWGDMKSIATPMILMKYSVDGERGNREYIITPNKLDANVLVDHKPLNRGIYNTLVYTSSIDINSVFSADLLEQVMDFMDSEAATGNIKEFVYILPVSSKRSITGINNVTFNGYDLTTQVQDIMLAGRNTDSISFKIPIEVINVDKDNIFTMNVEFKGANSISVVPTAKENVVRVSGGWHSPSFSGIIPTDREISDKGFNAVWNVANMNKNIMSLEQYENAFGSREGLSVKLYESITHYTPILRSVQYGIIFIILTLSVLFIFEVVSRTAPHIIQYAVIGSSLVMFYLLLLSLSEHISFIPSYLISSVAVAVPISLYTASVMKSKKYALGLFAVVFGLYLLLLSILYMERMALLTGTVIIMITIYVIMYFTRNLGGVVEEEPVNNLTNEAVIVDSKYEAPIKDIEEVKAENNSHEEKVEEKEKEENK